MDGIRQELISFIEEQECRLETNDHKGGWRKESFFELHARLQKQADQILEALYADDMNKVIRNSIDAGNFSMMMHDKACVRLGLVQ